jgi:hypothetical protein
MANAPVQFGIGVTDLKAFAKDVRQADKILAKNLRLALKKGADIVADQVRSNASRSSTIPRSVKSSSSPRSAKVVIKAAEAAPFEHMGKPGTFRHPVFGHRIAGWSSKPGRLPCQR